MTSLEERQKNLWFKDDVLEVDKKTEIEEHIKFLQTKKPKDWQYKLMAAREELKKLKKDAGEEKT